MRSLSSISAVISIIVASEAMVAAYELHVVPQAIVLDGKDARQRLVVMAETNASQADVTGQATFTSLMPAIVAVDSQGVVTAAGQNGQGQIRIQVGNHSLTVAITVRNAESYRHVTFERDIQPILTRFGCNSGACHGKARGQNGFQLSLLGFDNAFDYAALTQEARGRRLFPPAPEYSLLLRKASGSIPHGGGRKLPVGDPSYLKVLRWIAAGTPRTPSTAASLSHITVYPSQRRLLAGDTQQLLVTAHYSDGSTEDVTHMATFQSSDSVYVSVNDSGRVQAGPLPGEAAIMARYREKFAVCQVLVPLPDPAPAAEYANLPRKNFIDGYVWEKLQQFGITPSAPADDATFLRRASLDIIGRLPSAEEARLFLADPDPQKRERLIDRLLERPEYADFWANKWADLIRPNPYRAGIKAVYNLDAWLRESFRQNKPYDQFVRELITASGSTFHHGPVVMHRDRREPEEITTMVSQLFLGVRLDCAKCHHHPFEIWGQDDFYGFAAFFSRIGRKGQGISAPISGGEEIIYLAEKPLKGGVSHPVTGKVMQPRPLLGEPLDIPGEIDPRVVLADWVTSPKNPYFAKVIVNRVWADLMGRGIVDPVDDLRATNPPSNAPLLDALAADFRKNQHNLKSLIRTICTSYVYGLSTVPNSRNVGDNRNYSRHYRERLRAEVLLDAISDLTGIPESFSAMPPGSRAMELWTVRSQSIFLDTFGRPDPNQDPPCERTSETTVVQALHLMNAPQLHQKVIADGSRAAKLAASKKTAEEIVEELYLHCYSRFPKPDERQACVAWFQRPNLTRRQAIEDILWALINTPEFVFKN